jgi:hypothetical protein
MLRFSDLVVTSWTVVALLVVPVASAADPIPVQIVAGSLNMSGTSGSLSLVGDDDFTFVGGVSIVGGVFGPAMSCLPCLPGNAVSLGAHWLGNDLSGTATFEGVTYTQVGSLAPGHAFGSVTFMQGSAVAPPLQGLTATIIAPFLFQGLFSFPPFNTPSFMTASLTGSGTASVVLGRANLDIPVWSYSSAVYEFEPVPEPGTLILFGTALAGPAFRRRQFRPARCNEDP